MPKGSRKLTPKQRAHRRRRREIGAPHPIGASTEMTTAPDTELSAPPQTSSEQASPPPAAVSPRPARAAAVAAAARVARPTSTLRQDPFLTTELRRIGVMSVSIFAILVVLSFFLR